jgi:ABC-type branched-subunit amino acid transport system substrate-binding protein
LPSSAASSATHCPTQITYALRALEQHQAQGGKYENPLSGVVAAALLLAASTPALAEDTLTIGFTVSQTASSTTTSLSQMRGFELWRDEVNAKGRLKAGDRTYKVNFVTYDDESQSARV